MRKRKLLLIALACAAAALFAAQARGDAAEEIQRRGVKMESRVSAAGLQVEKIMWLPLCRAIEKPNFSSTEQISRAVRRGSFGIRRRFQR